MSRARPIYGQWFDMNQNGQPARVAQLELLASAENIEIDDLLDEGLTQGEVVERLRASLGQVVPEEVLERQRARREASALMPRCRFHAVHGGECDGEITRHHFFPKWLMKELENYKAYAPRTICTIPLCVAPHRDFHMKSDEGGKSILPYITPEEGAFLHKMISELREQHPKIYDLMAGGDPRYSYEAQLIEDYERSRFLTATEFRVESSPLYVSSELAAGS